MVDLTIDGIAVSVPEHTTILKAAAQVGVKIPTLCYLENLNQIGACRICVVEVEGVDKLIAACNNEVAEGMTVSTNSAKVRMARRMNLELILSQHDVNCTSCLRNGNCSLQTLSRDLGILDEPYPKTYVNNDWNHDFPLIRDANKCVKCMRCIQVCDNVQAVHVWELRNRATRTTVGVTRGMAIEDTRCTLCGQCITHCPVGALYARDDTMRVFDALEDPNKVCVVQVAPAVRAAWGEQLGILREQATVGRMVSAIRRLGFDYVFDTDFSADLTITEEASELVQRLQTRADDPHAFPMFTSCCPGWIRYIKGHYPQYVDNLSTAKSPHQMFGAVLKSYYAEMMGIDPHNIFCVSIMPCVAKKHECALETMRDACGDPDVDAVLTTRELDRMIVAEHIDVDDILEEDFDLPLGTASGAGVIFGATGGVMEAALRTGYYYLTGTNPEPDAFKAVRGTKGWKEADFELPGKTLHVAVVHGLDNTRNLMDAIDAGKVHYDFVEVMACPGGCAGGGGQPIHDGLELAGERGKVLYNLDEHCDLRFSHENPAVIACYRDYLGEPLSEKAHHLLHSNHHDWNMPHV